MKSKMKLHPFYECAQRADEIRRKRTNTKIYQQWNCGHCGAKQTMPDDGVFYKLGDCEECGKRTNIEQDGCNYMVHYEFGDASDIADFFKGVGHAKAKDQS